MIKIYVSTIILIREKERGRKRERKGEKRLKKQFDTLISFFTSKSCSTNFIKIKLKEKKKEENASSELERK